MQRLRYEVDPHNRLVVSGTGKRLPLARFRRVIEGRFKLGPGNSLIYHIKGPMYGLKPQHKAPHQVKLRGRWSLNKSHELVLTMDKWRRLRVGDELTLQGQIVAVSASSLSFALTTRTKQGLATKDILRLQGLWQADRHNRLSFRVNKGLGRHDTLTFDGIWEVNKQHKIVYRYEKAQLRRKKRLKKTLIFAGRWDIARRNRLSYKLSLDGKSAFEFRAGTGLLGGNYIKFEIGIGISDKKQAVQRNITLFGKWKIKRNIGLLFEIAYEQGRAQAIIFGADAKLTAQEEIDFKLKNHLRKDLSLELKLSRKLLHGDGEAFLKLLKDKKAASVYVGMAWRW